MAPRFIGPIRLHEECKYVSPYEKVTLTLNELDDTIKAYHHDDGNEPSIPSEIYEAVFHRAIWLFIAKGNEAARQLLLTLVKDNKSHMIRQFLSSSTVSIARLLDCTLFPSKDLFGMMLDGSNLMFQQVPQNELFMEMLWSAFEQLCKNEECRLNMSRLFPLMVFVASCPEKVFGFAKELAVFSFAFNHCDVEAVVKNLKESNVTEEQKRLVAKELACFLGIENEEILRSLLERRVFCKEHVSFPSRPASRHEPFIDMLTPYVTIGYTGAPYWAHHLITAIIQYIQETDINEDADLDELLAGLFYRGCAMAEPFNLARRLITLMLHIEEHGCDCAVLMAALDRFLTNQTSEIVSEQARSVHQKNIDKVFSGLELLAGFGLHVKLVQSILERFGIAHERGKVGKGEEQDQEGLAQFKKEQKIFNAPFSMIPMDKVLFVEPSASEEARSFYLETKRDFECSTLYERFHTLQNALDPNEQHILGIPANSFAFIFTEDDVAKVPEGCRCILLKDQ